MAGGLLSAIRGAGKGGLKKVSSSGPPARKSGGGGGGGDFLSQIRGGANLKKSSARAPAAAAAPGGGDLLSQIRAGRNLKSAKARTQGELPNLKNMDAVQTGDLMSTLHSALMKRKAAMKDVESSDDSGWSD
jgi:hypothetical protein